MTPGREDPPAEIGDGELLVDPTARKDQLQDIAYEKARDMMIGYGMDNEFADRHAHMYALQTRAIHGIVDLENMVAAEYAQKMKEIEQSVASDKKLIELGKKYAEAERIRKIEAIPSVDDGNTFSGIEKAEADTFVRNAVAATRKAIAAKGSLYDDADETSLDGIDVDTTTYAIAARREFMKLAMEERRKAYENWITAYTAMIAEYMGAEIASREALVIALNLAAVKGLADTEYKAELQNNIDEAIRKFKAGSLEDIKADTESGLMPGGLDPRTQAGVSMDTDGGYQAALDALPTDIRAAADKIIAQMENAGVSQAGIKDHIRKWIEREAWALAGPYEGPPSVTDLRRSPIYIKAFDTLSQNGIPEDLAEKLAFQATSEDNVDAFIQQQVEYYNELFKAKENAGVESSELTPSQIKYYTELADKLENNGKTRFQDRIDSGWGIEGGKAIINKATEDKNPIIAQRAVEQLAALSAAVSSAGLIDAETGVLTPLGSRLASGDDSAWAEIAKDVWESAKEISPKHIAIIVLVTVGLIKAPAWISVLGPLGKSGAAYRLAQAMGLGAILYGTGAGSAEPGDTGPPGRNYPGSSGQIQGVDGAQAYWTPDGIGWTLPVPETDHGYEKEINRLIDVVKSLQNKALYGDPAKTAERKQQASNIIKVISRLYNKQEVIPLPGDGTANVDTFKDMPLDFSDIPISELTSGQLNSELKRVNSEIQTPGVSRERVKELTDRLMALKKQQRKNRRSKP